MSIHSTACPRNCYSTCSFKVHVKNNKVVNIDPHPGNLATPEGICLKGLAYVERANSKDRILTPLIKNQKTGKFEKADWKTTFELLAKKIKHFQGNFGKHSILFYAASGMSGLVNGFSSSFWKMIGGATTMYGNLCWPAGLEATHLTLGDNKHNAPWDLENAKLIIFWGKNAVETNIQQMIPVEKAIEKGAKVLVIDPRRTQTSEKADLFIQPKPGTDGALALAIAKLLIDNQQYDNDFVEKHVSGFEEFAESLKKYTVRELASIADVDEILIHELAELIANTKPMTIIPGYGMQRFSNGGQTIRCILALSVITGNIGKKGACWHYANLQSYVFDSLKEPMSYYPPEKPDGIFRREISMAKLGEDMLNIKDPELKMIWVERGNPIAQNPDTNTVLKAFRKLEFRVVVDQFLTDTAMEADVVLPAKNMFEQSDIIGSYWNPYVQYKPKVVETFRGCKTRNRNLLLFG
jgi:anaerobic selenocysteine-containing dehydrogenase